MIEFTRKKTVNLKKNISNCMQFDILKIEKKMIYFYNI